MDDAAKLVAEDTQIKYPEYYYRYPNNQFFLWLIVQIFKVIRFFAKDITPAGLKTTSLFIAAGMVQLGVTLLYLAVRVRWGQRVAFAISVVTLLYTPLYLYAGFAYTDTFSLPFICALLLLWALAERSKGGASERTGCLGLWIGMGVCAGIGGKIKIMVVFFLIAICVTDLFAGHEKNSRRLIRNILAIMVCIGVMVVCNLLSATVIRPDRDMTERYKFPLQHWIMMSFNPSCDGGYNQEDVDYTCSFVSLEERKEKDWERLEQRIAMLGVSGTLRHIAYDKLKRTWCNPSLSGANYISRKSLIKCDFLYQILAEDGRYYGVFYVYLCIVHFLVLFGCAASAWNIRQEKPGLIYVVQLAIFGIALFLSFWECNGRYLYTFIPAMLVCAVWGWNNLFRVCSKSDTVHDQVGIV